MEPKLTLIEIYQDAYDIEIKRLVELCESEYLQYVEAHQFSAAKKCFAAQLWQESNKRYNLCHEGFVFGLIRFEKYFENEYKLFAKQPIEQNFAKAKDKFVLSWESDSRSTYVTEFFTYPVDYILSELGKYQACKEWGFDPFNQGEIKSKFISADYESDTLKSNEVAPDNTPESTLTLELGSFKVLGNVSDDQILLVRKCLLDSLLIDDIEEEDFKTNFKGEGLIKINWRGKLKLLIRLLDGLHFMLSHNSYATIKEYKSIRFKSATYRFAFKGKELNEDSWNSTRNHFKEIDKKFDPDFEKIETIIDAIKNFKKE